MADALFDKVYNPDVLSCLANLSNDEVFTPPEVANAMLDMLPQKLFSDPDATFLDPACKTGVFLREIAKRLIVGLEDKIPDLQKRLDHIFHKQLYGIAITELTSLLSRRSLYCSKYPSSNYSVSVFNSVEGNIRYKKINHIWKDGKCTYCGAKQEQFDRDNDFDNHAYEWIHINKPEDIYKMHFTTIISNPPYQMSDGGSAGGAMPIYQKFVEQSKKIDSDYLVMIIPSRWFAGGRGLEEFRAGMLNDNKISTLVDFPKSRDCFTGVDIAGGVCYFLREKKHSGTCKFSSITQNKISTRERILNEFEVFIRDNIGLDIIHKVINKTRKSMAEIVEPVSPFGLRSFTRGVEKSFPGSVVLMSSAGKSYISRNDVPKGQDIIDKWKVCVGYLNPDRAGVNNASDGKSSVTTKIALYKPGTVITETYIVLGAFDTKEEAKNCASYIQTAFARFLVLLTLSSMHITKQNFQFVPLVNFDKTWTDEELSNYFGLSKEEIDYIETMIRPISLIEGGDDDTDE